MMCKHQGADGDLAHLDPAARQRGFFSHALWYVLVIGGLAILNLATSPHYPWFIWPLLGWGIGLVSHGMAFFSARAAAASEPIASSEPTPLPQEPGREWPDLDR
jgi:hypothetical protein